MLFELMETTQATFFEKYGLLIILVALLAVMFLWNFYRSRKYQKQEVDMQEQIKVGTKIKTYSGIYGTVVGFYDTTDGRVVKISLDGKATMEIDFRAIYGIDDKMTLDEAKKLEEEKAKLEEEAKQEAKVEEPKVEEKKEEVKEEPKKEEKVGEKKEEPTKTEKPVKEKVAKKESKPKTAKKPAKKAE
ncbi:MAG: preprotein translocase subunit YajC [Clostridiales bacterium]|nr:preprotein translocase subunit YajC [Candidatus Apopatousia equi]